MTTDGPEYGSRGASRAPRTHRQEPFAAVVPLDAADGVSVGAVEVDKVVGAAKPQRQLSVGERSHDPSAVGMPLARRTRDRTRTGGERGQDVRVLDTHEEMGWRAEAVLEASGSGRHPTLMPNTGDFAFVVSLRATDLWKKLVQTTLARSWGIAAGGTIWRGGGGGECVCVVCGHCVNMVMVRKWAMLPVSRQRTCV